MLRPDIINNAYLFSIVFFRSSSFAVIIVDVTPVASAEIASLSDRIPGFLSPIFSGFLLSKVAVTILDCSRTIFSAATGNSATFLPIT